MTTYQRNVSLDVLRVEYMEHSTNSTRHSFIFSFFHLTTLHRVLVRAYHMAGGKKMTLRTIKTTQKGPKSKTFCFFTHQVAPTWAFMQSSSTSILMCDVATTICTWFEADTSLSPLENFFLALYLMIRSTREHIKNGEKWVRYVPRWNNNIDGAKMRIHRWRWHRKL